VREQDVPDAAHPLEGLHELFEVAWRINQPVTIGMFDKEAVPAERLIHCADAEAVPDAEWILEGSETVQVAPQFQIIPVPGHTPGSMALLYDQRFLFTGDHLWWDPESRTLESPERLVWNESQLLRSIGKLLDYRFEWVLAGHGDRTRLPATEMRAKLAGLLERRRTAAGVGAR
jgi:glyoxylase-like metal-dependent hydrolase (beta-lactamase superfamily II)